MMYREWNRVWTTVALVGLLPGLCLPIVVTPVHAHSDWAAPFMGGMMAGHVLSNVAAQKRAQTEALQSMAYGGGGRPMPYRQPVGSYGRPEPAPAYAPPAAAPQPTPQQQLNQLDALAAGGYITPEEYKARRQAILNAM